MVARIICPVCQKEFKTERAKKYCSTACYKRARLIREYPKTERPCVVCGKMFVPPKKNDQKYCSPKCRKHYDYIIHKEDINKKNRQWQEQNIEHVREKRKELYRSNPELYKQQAKEWRVQNGERARQKVNDCHNNERFGGNRELVLERDGHKCVMCGREDGLNVHHKDESGQSEKPNNEPDNLETLCNSCHSQTHELSRWK
jgi:predicted nucleic acid-binding Zn ribbon protein